jgi:phosphatidate cytidylyltransferase
MSEISKRILVALVGIPIVIGAIWFGGWFFYTLLFLANAFAIDEYFNMLRFKTETLFYRFLYIFSSQILFATAYYLFNNDALIYFLFVLPILPMFYAIFDLKGNTKWGLTRVSGRNFGFMYITLSMVMFYFIREIDSLLLYLNSDFNFLELLNITDSENINEIKSFFGAKLLFSIFVSIWACDSFAFFIGRKFGKRKLAELVSPKKSVEGAIGGLIGAMIVGLAFYILDDFSKSYVYLIIAFICGTIGQAGDLIESLIKRDVGVKDSSSLIPGHGGVLDRVDSLIAVSPFILLILVIVL